MHNPRAGFLMTLVMFLAGATFLRCQQNVDSLQSALNFAGQDTNRVKALNALAFALRAVDPKQAMTYAEQGRDLAGQLNFDKGRGDSYNIIGVIHYRHG